MWRPVPPSLGPQRVVSARRLGLRCSGLPPPPPLLLLPVFHHHRCYCCLLLLPPLQERLLGEDGHPRKVKAGEDPHQCGLVLEWVFGSIVSTAEKARDGAKRCLGSVPPSAAEAHATLVRCAGGGGVCGLGGWVDCVCVRARVRARVCARMRARARASLTALIFLTSTVLSPPLPPLSPLPV